MRNSTAPEPRMIVSIWVMEPLSAIAKRVMRRLRNFGTGDDEIMIN